MNSRWPKIVFAALAVYALGYFASYYGRLPQVVAAHFNVRGEPNGWESKPVFFAVFFGALMIAVSLTFGIPLIIRATPTERINLPHKERWLGPAFREATLNFLSSWFEWFGCGLLVLLLLTFKYTMQANLNPADPPESTRIWFYLCGFGIFSLVWVARIRLHFGRVPPDDSSMGEKR